MALKIQYCSDLHLEFKENKAFLKKNPLQVTGDVLLLAGDIAPFVEIDKHKDFFDEMSNKFEMVYWLPGNHEYYHSDVSKKSGALNEKIRNNFSLVNNISIVQNNVRFVFSTLWSKISPANEWSIVSGISDFHVIKYFGERLSALHYNHLHNEARNFIEEEVNKPFSGKTVVATHHVPTFMHYPEIYRGSAINEGFAVELFDAIEPSNIDYWIYGHHHDNIPEFNIGNTKMLTNQLGYVRQNEHLRFSCDRQITID